jgi:isopenicillin-N N-acyltransferase-like protein
MPRPPFPFISVSGSPAERGRQYGRLAGDRIRKSLDIYSAAFANVGLAWKEVSELARRYRPEIEVYSREAIVEIDGIAAGAELESEAIIALNARTELLYAARGVTTSTTDLAEGCTGVIVMPEAAANGRLIHAQNWDWIATCVEAAIVMRHECEDGSSFISFNEAGVLARTGFNSSGIGLTANFLSCNHDGDGHGVPIPFLRRQVLMSDTLAKALKHIYSAPRTFSNNMMLSERSGLAIDLETTPREVYWLAPERGLLVHANHFRSEAAKAKLIDTSIEKSPDTLYRDARVLKLLLPHLGKITVEHVKAALLDDYGSPAAVCRSPVPGPGGADCASVASLVMDTTRGKMWAAPAPYEGNPSFTEYSLT